MTIAVGPLLDSVSATLLDTARRTWTLQGYLVPFLNEALAATAAVKPDMYVLKEYITLAAGTSQRIPEDGVALIDLLDNEVSMKTITQVDTELLTESNRFWPAATRKLDVEHYCFDPRDPRRFEVTPPNNGYGSVQMLYGAVPDPVTGSSGESLSISASFGPIFTAYVLAKCYGVNTKRQDMTKEAAHMNQWGTLVGLKSKGQIMVAPKVAVSEGKT